MSALSDRTPAIAGSSGWGGAARGATARQVAAAAAGGSPLAKAQLAARLAGYVAGQTAVGRAADIAGRPAIKLVGAAVALVAGAGTLIVLMTLMLITGMSGVSAAPGEGSDGTGRGPRRSRCAKSHRHICVCIRRRLCATG